MSSWASTKYKATNWSAYNEALRQRGSFSIWFDSEMIWVPRSTGRRRRQQQFSVFRNPDLPHAESPVRPAFAANHGLRANPVAVGRVGLAVPDFSPLCRPIARQGHAQHDPERGIDEQTLEVWPVEVTTSNVGNAPMLSELLAQIRPDQGITSATADGACDTRKCHDAIAARDAHAIIPPRQNAKPRKPTSAGAIARNEVAMLRNTSTAPYGAPSRQHPLDAPAGQWMHCVKLIGQSLMARDFDRQVAEIQIRIAVLNRYAALGIPVSEPAG